MLIRIVTAEDKSDLLEWRNHPQTRAMFFDQDVVPEDVHENWFNKMMASHDQTLFIGQRGDDKIGMVRFDLDAASHTAAISVNVNPAHRGKRYSKHLLGAAILAFLDKHDVSLTAQVKLDNDASLKLFRGLGFIDHGSDDHKLDLIYQHKPLTFAPISDDDAEALYDLLKKREHSISHQHMPSFEDHCQFVKSHPYRNWFSVKADHIIGSFYTQDDNSIGINLIAPKILDVLAILNYIRDELTPAVAQPSKVPPYFFFNIASSHHVMQSILSDLNLTPLQIAYRI